MNSPAPFIFDGTLVVRTLERDGDPWFVATDVCAALGIANSRDAVSRLDEDEKDVALTDTLGGAQETTIINESGLYTIILRTREAVISGTPQHRFRKWITSEVIPAIRRTGSYTFAEGSEREFLLRETEEAMTELRARRDIMGLELRRLEKRRRRLGGEMLSLATGRPFARTAPGKPATLYGMEDITSNIPVEGIRVSGLQRAVKAATGMGSTRFYEMWMAIKASGAVEISGGIVRLRTGISSPSTTSPSDGG